MKKKFFSRPVLTWSKVDFLCALFLHTKFMYIMSCWRGKRRKLLTNGPTLLKNAPEKKSAHSKCTRCCSKSQRLQDWIQASKSPHFVLSESFERRHKSRLWTWLDFWKFLYCALAGLVVRVIFQIGGILWIYHWQVTRKSTLRFISYHL